MSNKLLRKILDDIDALPGSELRKLIEGGIEEIDLSRALFDSLADGHVVVSKERKIMLANKTMMRLIPSDRRHRIREGARIDDASFDGDVKRYVLSVLTGKERPDARDFAFQQGEETRLMRVSFSSIDIDSERYTDIVVRDITEEMNRETRLRRSESLASMTTMAAGIAHEIKNPLAAMKIHLQLLRKAFSAKGSLTGDDADRYLSVLDEEIDHLNTIAVDFLFAVRPMNVELRLGSINSVIDDLVVFLTPEAGDKKIEIRTELESFMPSVELDQRYLRQCLLNLVENAFAAMPGGGVLRIATKLDGDFETIRIEDNGTGIDEESLSKIFEPYFTTKASGTGLGLTVVYKVIKEHRGDIFVTSEQGKGTVFTIKLPVPGNQRRALVDKEEESGNAADR